MGQNDDKCINLFLFHGLTESISEEEMREVCCMSSLGTG